MVSWLLEECNPVVLVLILTLVSVGRLPPGARGRKKSILLAFLFSIHHLQNYEQTIILEWATQRNDDVTRSLAQRSCFHFNRGTWVRTHKKTPGNKIPFPTHTEMEFCFRDTKTIPFPRHQNYSVSETPKLFCFQDTKTEFCFHSTQNKICFHSTWNEIPFPLHSKQNSVSRVPYSINPNTLLWYNVTHHCANHLTWCLLPVIVIRLLPFTLLFLVTALLVFLPTLITLCLGFVLRTLPMT
jgi:hypothetical protein